MPEQASSGVVDPKRTPSSSQFNSILHGLEAVASKIVLQSMITSSFNNEDRFDWRPQVGLRVAIPDKHQWVRIERAPASELRNRLFPFPNVRGNRHKKAPPTLELPERSLAWWFGQLIHYGLPITIDKDNAKESLKLAIQEDRLAVPTKLLMIEGRLKRLYVVDPPIRPGMNAPSLSAHRNTGSMSQAATQPASQPLTQSTSQLHHTRPQTGVLSVRKPPSDHSSKTREVASHPVHLDLDSDSDSTSSDESDAEPFRVPEDQRHLFTPYGARITKPAEYPGLREKEERLKREQELKQRLAKKNSKAERVDAGSHLTIIAGNDSGTFGHMNVSESYDRREGVDEADFQTLPNFASHMPACKEGLSDLNCVTRKSTKDKGKESVVDLSDTQNESDNETGSEIFYTPIETMKKTLSDQTDIDSSVTRSLFGPRTSPGKKVHDSSGSMIVGLKSETGANTETTSSDRKQKDSRPAQSACEHGQGSSSRRSWVETGNRARMIQGPLEAENEVHHLGLCKKELLIETSSASESDRYDDDQDQITAEKELDKANHKRVKSVTTTDFKGLTDDTIALSKSSGQKIAKAVVSAVEVVPNNHGSGPVVKNSTKASRKKAKQLEKKDKNLRTQSKPASAELVNNNKSVRQQQNQDQAPSNDERKKKHCKSGLDAKPHTQAAAQLPVVQDLTGCGLIKMSGGLHEDDINVVQGEGPFGDRLRSNSPFIKHPPWARNSRNSSPGLPSQQEENDNDNEDGSDWDLPSLTGLFSSQETPENWKSKERRIQEAQKRKSDIEKSYDPDSVPALREQLAALPAYLKTSMRHDSPELTLNWPVQITPSAPEGTPLIDSHHRSRSTKTPAPTSQKRKRRSMIEIEADTYKDSEPKRSRMASSQPDLALSLGGVDTKTGVFKSPKVSKSKSTSRNRKSKKDKKHVSFETEAGDVSNDFDEPYDQRTARHKARSMGSIRQSIEI